MVKNMEKEHLYGQTELLMKDNLLIIISKEKELIDGLTIENM
jgi:hypothetical protein